MLVDTDKAALHDAKEAFQRIHMDIAPNVFALGVVHAFMRRDRRVNVIRALSVTRRISLRRFLRRWRATPAMIERNRTGVSTALEQGSKRSHGAFCGRQPCASSCANWSKRFSSLPRSCQRRPAGQHRRPEPCKANPMAKVPRGFHPAAQGALELAVLSPFWTSKAGG